MAGREPLAAGWHTDAGLNAFIRTIPLRYLNPEESRSYLNLRRVSPEQHQAVLDFTRGHPLALSLVADVLDQRPEQQLKKFNLAPPTISGVSNDQRSANSNRRIYLGSRRAVALHTAFAGTARIGL